MKPKTKLQQEVATLSVTLPNIKKQVQAWAFENCIEHLGFRLKAKGIQCLSCGHVWKELSPAAWLRPQKITTGQPYAYQTKIVYNEFGADCPKCKRHLKVVDTQARTEKQMIFCAAITISGDYQVNRYFQMYVDHKAGEAPKVDLLEITQQWMHPNGKVQVVSRLRGMYQSPYFHGELEIRGSNKIGSYDIYTENIYPELQVQPLYQRNGFNGVFAGISPYRLFHNLMTDPICETLYKAGYYGFLEVRIYERAGSIAKHWQSIRICMRNNYNLMGKDVLTWLDYMEQLAKLGKDLRNPVYVCPKDLHAAHQEYLAKVAAVREREQLMQEERNYDYAAHKAKYLHLSFTDGQITVQALQSIADFKTEGELLNHCVYKNNYFSKANSLVLSARIDGKPVETIEINLTTMKITQSRGLNNKPTEWHEQIVNLVNKNMRKVRKAHKAAPEAAAIAA